MWRLWLCIFIAVLGLSMLIADLGTAGMPCCR